MNESDKKLVIYGLGILAVYILILKPILIKLGLQSDPEREKTEERKTSQIDEQIKLVTKTQQPTKSVQEWQTIADAIYEDLRYVGYADNKKDAVYQVCRVKNDADFWTLYKLFAKRRDYVFGIPSGSLMDLQQYLKANLSQSDFDVINNNYKRKGIKFSF